MLESVTSHDEIFHDISKHASTDGYGMEDDIKNHHHDDSN